MFVVIGLMCCMTADVLLEIQFIWGILVFGLGHICFITAFLSRQKPNGITAVMFVMFYTVILWIFRKEISGLGHLRNPAFIYMGLLCIDRSALFSCVRCDDCMADSEENSEDEI